ncbi:hypothetical protein ACFE04_007525 [Oxalis oulophora]
MNTSSDGGCGCFPDEVVMEILSKLPIKSLFQAKSVCKRWNELTLGNYFIHLVKLSLSNINNPPMLLAEVSDCYSTQQQQQHQQQHHSLILSCVDDHHSRGGGVTHLSLDFLQDRVKIMASCNGLLCCSSIRDMGVFYVCNPLTRTFTMLPRIIFNPNNNDNTNPFVVVPDTEIILVGLAHNLLTDRFYVVVVAFHKLLGHLRDGPLMCWIFDSHDSSTNVWKNIPTFVDQEESFTHMSGTRVVYVSGALHCLSSKAPRVHALDLERQRWTKISLPQEIRYGRGNRFYLLELDGCLSLIQISNTLMKTWVMNDYVMEEWKIVEEVSLKCIRGMIAGIFPISQNTDYVFFATHKHVFVYHRKSKEWKEMYSVQNNSTLPLWFSAFPFRSTLFSFR